MDFTPDGLLPPGLSHSAESWRGTWTGAFGSQWRPMLALFGVLLFLAGYWYPLADPDLGIHIATGEWIVRRGQWPFVEPFAWTRAGEPFQAYSWLPEVTYFLLIDRIGPVALHVLHGLSITAVAAAMLPLGRALGWSAWATVLSAVGNVMAALVIATLLRPQIILFIAMPLAWALVYRAREADDARWLLAGLFALSAVLVNSHLLFPLLGVPCVLLLTHPPRQRWRLFVVPLCIIAGWLLTPYLLELPAVFQLNFGHNRMLGPPSAITDYIPGFEWVLHLDEVGLVFVPLLALIPWILGPRMTASERFWHGLSWFAGMVLFALAVRALAVWWLVALPLVGVAIGLLPDPVLTSVRLAQRGIVLVIAIAFAAVAFEDGSDPFKAEGDADVRTLPSDAARAVEPIVRWLDCRIPSRPATRLLTVHNYGSYLVWRTPWLSESIDGRTIFPDSVSYGEGYLRLPVRELKVSPWRSAEVAIVPAHYAVAAVLDTAAEWRRAASVAAPSGRLRTIGLWVREDWWLRNSPDPLPDRPVTLSRRLPVTAPDCERPPIARVVRGPGSFDALIAARPVVTAP